MGMFDTVFVSQSLIDEVTRGTDITIESFNGYCNFQTKDLDNSLTDFFIEADGTFVWEKQEYKITENADKAWSLPHVDPVGVSQKIEDTRTAYVDFYDFYHTSDERVFVTFTAHIKNGRLVEPITIKKIEKDNLKEEAERSKKIREQWIAVENTWQWQMASFISELKWKIELLFRPFKNKLNTLEETLREQAKTKNKPLFK